MPLDKIVVLILAIVFFGGITFMIWKSRQGEQNSEEVPAPGVPENTAEETPNNNRGKKRKKSKS